MVFFGATSRRTTVRSTFGTTVGGLLVPEFYNLMNSASPIQTTEDRIALRC